MAYSSGILRNRVTILNRTEAQQGKFGLDSSGVEFETAGTVWAEVTWVRGKQAMNVGALDVSIVNDRSRVMYDGKTYQILGDTFHAQRQDNTIQFHAQLVVKE